MTNRRRKRKKSNKPPIKKAAPMSSWKRIWIWFVKYWKIALSVLTVLTLFIAAFQGCDYFISKSKSKHQSFIEEKYIDGILAPVRYDNKIEVKFGGGRFVKNITDPFDLMDEPSFGCSKKMGNGKIDFDAGFSFKIIYQNGVFVISLICRDLKTGSVIVQIEKNKILINKNVSDFHSDSKSLEIIDQYGYVAFRMWTDDYGIVNINGYFPGKFCTIFINDPVVMNYTYHDSKDYLTESITQAEKLKPMFVK